MTNTTGSTISTSDSTELNNFPVAQLGGRKKRGNGHKANCQCPICKNMRKKYKGGEDPNWDIEMGEKPITQVDTPVAASPDEYDALDAAEKGQNNPAGGSKRRRSRKTKKHTKNGRKHRKTHRKRRSSRRH